MNSDINKQVQDIFYKVFKTEQDKEQVYTILQDFPFFQKFFVQNNIQKEFILQLINDMTIEEYETGQVVFYENEQSNDKFYICLSGNYYLIVFQKLYQFYNQGGVSVFKSKDLNVFQSLSNKEKNHLGAPSSQKAYRGSIYVDKVSIRNYGNKLRETLLKYTKNEEDFQNILNNFKEQLIWRDQYVYLKKQQEQLGVEISSDEDPDDIDVDLDDRTKSKIREQMQKKNKKKQEKRQQKIIDQQKFELINTIEKIGIPRVHLGKGSSFGELAVMCSDPKQVQLQFINCNLNNFNKNYLSNNQVVQKIALIHLLIGLKKCIYYNNIKNIINNIIKKIFLTFIENIKSLKWRNQVNYQNLKIIELIFLIKLLDINFSQLKQINNREFLMKVVPGLKDITSTSIQSDLISSFYSRIMNKNEYLVKQNEENNKIYFLIEGEVRISMTGLKYLFKQFSNIFEIYKILIVWINYENIINNGTSKENYQKQLIDITICDVTQGIFGEEILMNDCYSYSIQVISQNAKFMFVEYNNLMGFPEETIQKLKNDFEFKEINRLQHLQNQINHHQQVKNEHQQQVKFKGVISKFYQNLYNYNQYTLSKFEKKEQREIEIQIVENKNKYQKSIPEILKICDKVAVTRKIFEGLYKKKPVQVKGNQQQTVEYEYDEIEQPTFVKKKNKKIIQDPTPIRANLKQELDIKEFTDQQINIYMRDFSFDKQDVNVPRSFFDPGYRFKLKLNKLLAENFASLRFPKQELPPQPNNVQTKQVQEVTKKIMNECRDINYSKMILSSYQENTYENESGKLFFDQSMKNQKHNRRSLSYSKNQDDVFLTLDDNSDSVIEFNQQKRPMNKQLSIKDVILRRNFKKSKQYFPSLNKQQNSQIESKHLNQDDANIEAIKNHMRQYNQIDIDGNNNKDLKNLINQVQDLVNLDSKNNQNIQIETVNIDIKNKELPTINQVDQSSIITQSQQIDSQQVTKLQGHQLRAQLRDQKQQQQKLLKEQKQYEKQQQLLLEQEKQEKANQIKQILQKKNDQLKKDYEKNLKQAKQLDLKDKFYKLDLDVKYKFEF